MQARRELKSLRESADTVSPVVLGPIRIAA
jgi:hypothetical protein